MLTALGLSVLPPVPAYETRWFPQELDHFDATGGVKWPHRYLIATQHWGAQGPLANGCRGPILFYTGNEGPIESFWGSNGFMQQVLAPRLGALLVFAEERYYGSSLPQGRAGKFTYLSTEQVTRPLAKRSGADGEGGGGGGVSMRQLAVLRGGCVAWHLCCVAPVLPGTCAAWRLCAWHLYCVAAVAWHLCCLAGPHGWLLAWNVLADYDAP